MKETKVGKCNIFSILQITYVGMTAVCNVDNRLDGKHGFVGWRLCRNKKI